jgi:hypothetical protein
MTTISYAPPKSTSHGHGSRLRSARKAWEAVQTFLSEHTVAELGSPLKLTVFGPSLWNVDAAQATVATGVRAA